MKLKTLLGDYPVTAALKKGQVRSDKVEFDFADVKVPSSAFKRVVRNLEFDVAELAVITYLIAKAHGKPLVLLPAVMIARFQHPFLIYNAARGVMKPEDLKGKRVGIRSYSVTTSAWLRGMLAADHGVSADSVTWVTERGEDIDFEPHKGLRIERIRDDQTLDQMLLDGEIDDFIEAVEASRRPG